MQIGASLNRRPAPITQHRFKVELNFAQVRVSLYRYLVEMVEANGQTVIPDTALTDPLDQVAVWLSKRSDEELVADALGKRYVNYYGRLIEIEDDDKTWLCLTGACGNGKTTTLRAIARLLEHIHTDANGKYAKMAPFSWRFIAATTLAEMCVNDKLTYAGIRNRQLLLIDDVGREPREILDYGNPITPFIDLMQYRYNNHLGTIFTTNLNADQLRERYGNRIGDRMKECCKIVPFLGKSFRGRKEQIKMDI